jgi:UDP-N-acetylglucosamine transferase subunit ALG13
VIFATVGTQLPFPRLIAALDALAGDLDEPIVAQTADPGAAPPRHLDARAAMDPATYDRLFAAARVVVAHAGIGTILSAQRHGKPLVIVPRRLALNEHRNDHQLATARHVSTLPGIHVAWEVTDLADLLTRPDLAPASTALSPTRDRLIARLRAFIDG